MQAVAEQDRSRHWRFLREALSGAHQDFTEGSLTRGIALLAVPTVLEMAMESTFGIVDAFWVAGLGSDAMAAVAAVQSIGCGILVGVITGIVGAVFAPHLLAVMHAQPSVIRTGSAYSRIVLGGNMSIILLF